jgi:hypothetical protein
MDSRLRGNDGCFERISIPNDTSTGLPKGANFAWQQDIIAAFSGSIVSGIGGSKIEGMLKKSRAGECHSKFTERSQAIFIPVED